MKIIYYLVPGFFVAIVSCIIYLKFDVRLSGTITYILILTLFVTGIYLTFTSIKQFQKDRKEWSLYVTEGAFIRSVELADNESVSYEYIYEYYVDGKRYEYTHHFMYFSEVPLYNEKKIDIRYNPENPQEIRAMDLEYGNRLLIGPICIVFTLLLLFILLMAKK